MKKNAIKLNESDLNKIVYESVKKILKEAYGDDFSSNSTLNGNIPFSDSDIEKIVRESVPYKKWARFMAQKDHEYNGVDFEDALNGMQMEFYEDCIKEFLKALHSGYFNDVKIENTSDLIKEFTDFSTYYFEWNE